MIGALKGERKREEGGEKERDREREGERERESRIPCVNIFKTKFCEENRSL